MPVHYRIILIAYICVGYAVTGAAQAYNFKKYQVEDGLSNNTVSCVLQDRKGFIWVGTRDGLNRYDGYHFKVFRYENNNPKSLGGDFVHCIVESAEGIIWVGTDKGLFQYDESKENFHLLDNKINYVRDIKITEDGKLWFISGKSFYTGTMLYCYDFQTKEIRSYPQPDNSNATSLCITNDHSLWIATSRGVLIKYNKTTDSFHSYPAFSQAESSLPKTIEKIYPVDAERILVGTSHRGLIEFNTITGTFQDLNIKNADNSPLFVRDILKYSNEEYWIATESGIFIYNPVTKKYINLKKNFNDPFSVSDNTIYSFWKDYEGGVWVATFFGGLNYYSRQYSLFTKIYPREKSNSLSGNIVREICDDKYGNVWVGTEDAGLNKMDPNTLSFTQYHSGNSESSLSYWNIHGLAAVGNKLWIGTFEHGLDVMDITTGRIINHYSAGPDSNSIKSNFIVTILKTSGNELLIGTYSGLYKFNPLKNNFTLIREVPADAFVYSLYEDHAGTIWIGTIGDGVYFFDSLKQRHGKLDVRALKKNQRLRNNVVGIFEDAKHVLWFATEGSGITCYDPVAETVLNYSTDNGLPSNFVYKILADRQGEIWISSSSGLVRFNPANKSFKIYDASNGILNNQFNYNSGFVDINGYVYFGSLGGMIRFNPKELTEFNYLPGLYITNLQINNKPVEIKDENSPLHQSVINTRHLDLTYDQSSISLDFAALRFDSPEAIEYAYMLEGVDNDWTVLKTNRRVYFTNLSPGNYTFKVKTISPTGHSGDKETKLEIHVSAPWWKTDIAYAGYCILIFAAGYFIFRSYKNRVKFQNQIRFAKHQYEKEKEIMDAKIEFFTAVAHEIRTPLTLIVGPLERVIDQTKDLPNLKTSLEYMEYNTNQLLKLTTQLLDFRKIESERFTINLEKVNVSALVQEVLQIFKPVAEMKHQDIEFKSQNPDIIAEVDQEALQKILSNLFSNAVKYAERKISVSLRIVNDGAFMLEIINDGHKIPDEMSDKIFEPFYRVETSAVHQSGTGIGLYISRTFAELHGGTLYLAKGLAEFNVFILTIPLSRAVSKNETIIAYEA